MTDLNNLSLIGRLTRDLELKYTSSGVAIGNFALAVNRSVKKGNEWSDETSFFDVTVFGKYAENLANKLVKGVQVSLTGYIKQDRWEKDGQKSSKVGIVAESITVLTKTEKANKTETKGTVEGATYSVKDADTGFSEDIPF